MGRSQAPNCPKINNKSPSRPSCSHSNTIYHDQLQGTMLVVLRTQTWHQGTLTQPLHCVLKHHVANPHLSTHMSTECGNIHAAIPMRSATKNSSQIKIPNHPRTVHTNNCIQRSLQPQLDCSLRPPFTAVYCYVM